MKRNILAATLASAVIGSLAFGPAVADESASKNRAGTERSMGQTMDDAAIVAKIKAGLLSSSEVEGLDVNVDARNGIVTLSGSADTMAERSSAERIAKSAEGVKSVDNKIVIKADGAPSPTPRTVPAPTTPSDATPPVN